MKLNNNTRPIDQRIALFILLICLLIFLVRCVEPDHITPDAVVNDIKMFNRAPILTDGNGIDIRDFSEYTIVTTSLDSLFAGVDCWETAEARVVSYPRKEFIDVVLGYTIDRIEGVVVDTFFTAAGGFSMSSATALSLMLGYTLQDFDVVCDGTTLFDSAMVVHGAVEYADSYVNGSHWIGIDLADHCCYALVTFTFTPPPPDTTEEVTVEDFKVSAGDTLTHHSVHIKDN